MRLARGPGAYRQEEVTLGDDLAVALDFPWLLIAAAMVFLMQTGFAMVEGGFCRAKNNTDLMNYTRA